MATATEKATAMERAMVTAIIKTLTPTLMTAH